MTPERAIATRHNRQKFVEAKDVEAFVNEFVVRFVSLSPNVKDTAATLAGEAIGILMDMLVYTPNEDVYDKRLKQRADQRRKAMKR